MPTGFNDEEVTASLAGHISRGVRGEWHVRKLTWRVEPSLYKSACEQEREMTRVDGKVSCRGLPVSSNVVTHLCFRHIYSSTILC